ncbi:MAG: tripartite tricarboxylate transporter substrate binding protein [Paucimonas sp.]|nr:tripartite tricarboxylate transporter substrate binding protein [Paucimonas sp.]
MAFLHIKRSGALLLAAAALLASAFAPGTAQAQSSQAYPNKPIRLLVGFGAGGPTDITFRKLAELASRHLGQPIVIENKPGAGATLAPSSMAKMDKPDGYTIAAATAGLLRYPHMQKVDWDPLRDFTWIAGLGGYSFVLAVRADSPHQQAKDLLAWARANPGQLSIGTAGSGTTMHLLSEALGSMAGAQINHIGFKSSSEAATNLLGGHVVAAVDAAGSIVPHGSKLRILLSFDEKPAAWLPGVPTARSLGYDLAYPAPYGLVGPKGMPPEVVKKLSEAFKAAAEDPEYRKTLDNLRQTEWYRGPADYEKWAREFYVSERSLVERAKLLKQ